MSLDLQERHTNALTLSPTLRELNFDLSSVKFAPRCSKGSGAHHASRPCVCGRSITRNKQGQPTLSPRKIHNGAYRIVPLQNSYAPSSDILQFIVALFYCPHAMRSYIRSQSAAATTVRLRDRYVPHIQGKSRKVSPRLARVHVRPRHSFTDAELRRTGPSACPECLERAHRELKRQTQGETRQERHAE